MTPAGVTLRMRLSLVSARYRLPAASTASADGPFSSAAVAGPPSPGGTGPAMGAIAAEALDAVAGIGGDDARRHLADHLVVGVSNEEGAGGVHRHRCWVSQLGSAGVATVARVPIGAVPGHGRDGAVGSHHADHVV